MSKSTTVSKEDSYKLKELLHVADYQVQEVGSPGSDQHVVHASNSSAVDLRSVIRRPSSRWTHSFLLVHVNKVNAYTMFVRTAEDKIKWMEALNEAYRNAHLSEHVNGDHDLHMTTYDQPTSCSVCFKLLKGLFYQGYKCAKCSRSVHLGCASNLIFCGQASMPPSLPPRPTSIQLPTVQNGDSIDDDDQQADHQCSSLIRKGSDTSNGSLLVIPPLPMTPVDSYSSRTAHPDYINTRMEEHTWYVGEMVSISTVDLNNFVCSGKPFR